MHTSTTDGNSMKVNPGQSVGPFYLGMDIGTALVAACHYEETPDLYTEESNPFLSDTVIEIPSLGFRLCFHGYTQKLHVIILSFEYLNESEDNNSEIITRPINIRSSPSYNVQPLLNFLLCNELLIRNSNSLPDLRYIYRLCGPTTPGHYVARTLNLSNGTIEDDLDNTNYHDKMMKQSVFYYLKYPGIAFQFNIPYNDYELIKNSDDPEVVPFVLPFSSKQRSSSHQYCSPILNRILIYSSDVTFREGTSCPDCAIYQQSTLCHSKQLDPRNVNFNFSNNLQDMMTIIIRLKEGISLPSGDIVHFGASLQDTYQCIGPPDRVTLKELDVVKIMSANPELRETLWKTTETSFHVPIQSEETIHQLGLNCEVSDHTHLSESTDYFCNYFHKGFDLMFCGLTHRLKKIICHTNIPGHCQFGDYHRCFFKLIIKDPMSHIDQEITTDSEWDSIQHVLGQPSPPLLVDPSLESGSRQSSSMSHDLVIPFSVRKFYGYPGVVIEIFNKRWIASITIF